MPMKMVPIQRAVVTCSLSREGARRILTEQPSAVASSTKLTSAQLCRARNKKNVSRARIDLIALGRTGDTVMLDTPGPVPLASCSLSPRREGLWGRRPPASTHQRIEDPRVLDIPRQYRPLGQDVLHRLVGPVSEDLQPDHRAHR